MGAKALAKKQDTQAVPAAHDAQQAPEARQDPDNVAIRIDTDKKPTESPDHGHLAGSQQPTGLA